MNLSVFIRHALRSLDLSVEFQSTGRLTALFGPSGCGKTTVVNAIAGLLRPTDACISLGEKVFVDTQRNIWTPPHLRRVGYVFQDARLLPHLSVAQNLRYGQWFTGHSARYVKEETVVDLLGLSPLLQRNPMHLSGGERQRVAIGRALLQSPRLLLMDEPLASLDEARKQEILPYIERLRDEMKVPIVYVSHAIGEVTRLATDVVLMANGHVAQSGPVQDVLPALANAGEEFGRDAGILLSARVLSYDATNDLTTLDTDAGRIYVAGRIADAQGVFRVHIRATDVMLATAKPSHLSALNMFSGTVATVSEARGPSIDIAVQTGGSMIAARITRFSAKRLKLQPGKKVYAIIKTMSVRRPEA
jgi:molybdate transport system ATP-binding protein